MHVPLLSILASFPIILHTKHASIDVTTPVYSKFRSKTVFYSKMSQNYDN